MTYTLTGNTKKYPTALLLLIFMCATLFAPVMVMAGTKKIGESCSSSIGGNSECMSEDCEDSSKDTPNDDFCDCDDESDCRVEYGPANPNVTKWECWDGAHATYDLDYCVGTGPNIQKPIVKYAIPPRDTDFVDKLLDPQVTLDEIQKTIQTPQPRIRIPGLQFSKAQAVVDRGKTYMIFPFLGEYIAAIYRYAVVVASALAVLVIIVSGIQWMLPGNLLTSGEGDSKQTTNQAKKRIGGALIGLTIAVGSYTILYLVNPELVQFKNLRVKVVEEIDIASLSSSIVTCNNGKATITPITDADMHHRVPAADYKISQADVDKIAEQSCVDKCIARTTILKESGGNGLAIGHDENYPHNKRGNVCANVGARQKFLTGGKKYSTATFTKIANFSACNHNSTNIFNDDTFNIKSPPDYGLDWRYSHGIGLGQVTLIQGKAYTKQIDGPNGKEWARKISGRWYTVTDLLNPDKTIEATMYIMTNCINKANGSAEKFFECYAGGPGGIPRAMKKFCGCKKSMGQQFTECNKWN